MMDVCKDGYGHLKIVHQIIKLTSAAKLNEQANRESLQQRFYTCAKQRHRNAQIETIADFEEMCRSNVVDINLPDERSSLAGMHYASQCNHKMAVETLITHGGNIEAVDSDGCTPLHLAAYVGATDVLKILIQAAQDMVSEGPSYYIDIQDNTGKTALHHAFTAYARKSNEVEVERSKNEMKPEQTRRMRALWNFSVSDDPVADRRRESLQEFAAEDICAGSFDRLSKEQSHLKTQSQAAPQGSELSDRVLLVETKLKILKIKQEINRKDGERDPQNELANEYIDDEIEQLNADMRYLTWNKSDRRKIFLMFLMWTSVWRREKCNRELAFFESQRDSIRECAWYLIHNARCDLLKQDKHGRIPLHNYCMLTNNGHETIKQIFFSRKGVRSEEAMAAQTQIVDAHGNTCVHFAAMSGNRELCAYFKENASMALDFPRSRDKRTPLHLAALEGHMDCVQWLVENGAAVGSADINTFTPAEVAGQMRHWKIQQYLNESSQQLVKAIELGNEDEVIMLLNQRADPEFRTPMHMTPLMIACLHGQKSIVEKLVVRGAKCHGVHDIHGHSPMMWAIDSFDPDNKARLGICEILMKQGNAHPSEIIVTGADKSKAEMSIVHYVCLPGMAKLA